MVYGAATSNRIGPEWALVDPFTGPVKPNHPTSKLPKTDQPQNSFQLESLGSQIDT